MSTITTSSGATIAVGMKIPSHLDNDEVYLIKERERSIKAFRRSLPKRKPAAHTLPGPLTIIQMSR